MHLDLKPENILYRGNGYYKLCDFGCAHLNDIRSNVPLPDFHKNFGTSAYVAPEVKISHHCLLKNGQDIWSFGIILYEMLYRRHPFNLVNGEISKAEFESFCQGKTEI